MKKRSFQTAKTLFLLLITLSVAACAPVFPREALDRIDKHISFRELQSNPDRFKGAWVMLGGEIIAIRNAQEGTAIEVLQKPLDSDGRPFETDASEGRFFVRTDQFLDSAVYQPGRKITVIGEVSGNAIMPIDEIMYSYPVLSEKFLHLWRPSYGPRLFFGVGVSSHM